MAKKIIKNLTGSTLQILNRDVDNNQSYDIAPNFWLDLSTDENILALIDSGDLSVSNGSQFLDVVAGRAHVENPPGIVFEHSDIALLPAVGATAPELAKISDSVIGHVFAVNEEIFGQTRIDNLAGGSVSFELHMAIDNNVADRWIKFQLSYFTTIGHDDKAVNTVDGTLDIGPIEVPTTPFLAFEGHVSLPTSAFENGEHYLFLGVKRIAATGKTAPTNNPIILRYCKRFYKRLD